MQSSLSWIYLDIDPYERLIGRKSRWVPDSGNFSLSKLSRAMPLQSVENQVLHLINTPAQKFIVLYSGELRRDLNRESLVESQSWWTSLLF